MKNNFKTFFVSKKQFDILNFKLDSYVKNKKITSFTYRLSRPMSIHDTDIEKSIDLNIIGTSNIVESVK